jgi:hypothetical protein
VLPRNKVPHAAARTSERWPRSLCWKSSGARMSRCRMLRSREPLLSRWLLQAMVPTRALCPCIVRTLHTSEAPGHKL